MSKEVGAGGRFDIFLDSVFIMPFSYDNTSIPFSSSVNGA